MELLKFESRHGISNKIQLINTLIKDSISSKDYLNNTHVIEKLSEVIDRFTTHDRGHVLMSITMNKVTNLILITKVTDRESKYFPVNICFYAGLINNTIDKVVDVIVHEENYKENLHQFIREHCKKIDTQIIISSIIVDTLDGFKLNKSKIDEISKLINRESTNYLSITHPTHDLAQEISNDIIKRKKKIVDNIFEFSKDLDCPELILELSTNNNLEEKDIRIGQITKVVQIGNTRYYDLVLSRLGVGTKFIFHKRTAGVSSDEFSVVNFDKNFIGETNYNSDDIFLRIPYNLVDVGRYFIVFKRLNSQHNILVSSEERSDENYFESFKESINKYLHIACNKCVDVLKSGIKDQCKLIDYINSEQNMNKELSGVQLILKSLKKMVDEYKYLSKKEKAVGSDIFITDKISYNNSEGKIKYNNFSIAINDELIKSRLINLMSNFLLRYYRGEITEQSILDQITNDLFESLRVRLNSYIKEDQKIDIIINDKVKVKLDIKRKTTGLLTYINDIRFNKNEVITVIKEMTCYQEQENADMFIKNIGKIGLSVYIGITTGYEITANGKNQLYKFKKEKGRSNYTLILDNIDITIKGKSLISTLYSNFLEKNPRIANKISDIITESIPSTKDYIKYKLLIDSSYEAYKNKSKEFLDQKVKMTNSKYTTYINNANRKKMEAIYINGISGRNYILAYDLKESLVFIDPNVEIKDEVELFSNGKYICMVDQSNIKSNIGYDTVVSKLLALKNDSVIASKIYNLKDELND